MTDESSSSPRPSLDPGSPARIGWKLLAAFLLCALVPVSLHVLEVPVWLAGVAGVTVAAGLAWYAYARMFGTLHRLWTIASRVPAQHTENFRPQTPPADELDGLLELFDHLVSEVAKRKLGDTVELDRATLQASGPPPAPAKGLPRVHQATVATGDSVVGPAVALPRRMAEDLLLSARLDGPAAAKLFTAAVAVVRQDLEGLRSAPELKDAQRGIVDFQILLLDDEALNKGVQKCLGDGLSLPEALNNTFAAIVAKLESSGNAYIAARAADCLDLKQRLMDALLRQTHPGVDDLYAECAGKVVCCQQIYPSEVITLCRVGVKGIVAVTGTATSHAVILLQSFNLPALVNIDDLPVHLLAGRQVLLDTETRRLVLDPTPADEQHLRTPTTALSRGAWRAPVKLASGEEVRVLATINNVGVEAARASVSGADGVGLFRSEMGFIGQRELPSEEALTAEYRALTSAFAGRPIVMRMLDLGSDKLAGFQQDDEREENPCMGNRSMRLLLRRPTIFRQQLRAMLRAATPETCILFPMISGWHELHRVRDLADKIARELAATEQLDLDRVGYGIMVEVPGIVERFEDYVSEFSTFNLGTNDLTQYALAADRNNKDVAEYYNYLNPAILSMIHKVCRLGDAHERHVCLCGEMATDRAALPLLLGLGVRSFSVAYPQIVRMKERLRTLDLPECEALAAKALLCRSSDEVEALLKQQSRES